MLLNRFKKQIADCRKSESGNVAMISALVIIPILAVAGLAIDFQMTTSKKNHVQHLIDSATIFGSRAMQDGATKEEVIADIRDYIAAQTASLGTGTKCEQVKVNFQDGSEDIELSIRCTQPTTLTRLVGQDELNFTVTSGSTYAVGEVDVAFVFDVSGSMLGEGRIDSLKDAAAIAVDTLLPDTTAAKADVRLAMVTYATGVNAGPYFEDVTGVTDTYSSQVSIDKINCIKISPMGMCESWYPQSEEKITSDRVERCTLDRPNGSIFTDAEPDNGKYLVPTNRLAVQLVDALNLVDNKPMNPSSGFWGSSKTLTSGNGWYSTGGEFLFWKSGSWSANYWMEVNEDTGRIHQVFDTRKDLAHELVFSFVANPDDVSNGKLDIYAMPKAISASASVTTLEKYKIKEVRPGTGWNNWKTVHAEFIPTSDETRIVFRHAGSNDDDGGWIDNIWVLENAEHCPMQSPLPLTANKTVINDFIEDMEPAGGTAGHHGIAWGWYLISPEWKDIWPSESRPKAYLGSASSSTSAATSTKVAIIMTDGDFNHTSAAQYGTSAEQAEDYCDAMKAKGVVVFTVAFKAPENGKKTLKACASGENRAFEAGDDASLKEAYRSIAESISDLRITH